MSRIRWNWMGKLVATGVIIFVVATKMPDIIRSMFLEELFDRLDFLEELNKETVHQFQVLNDSLTVAYTKTTTEKAELERMLDRLTRMYNEELGGLTDSLETLGQELTAATTGAGTIDIAGSGKMDTTFEDSFLRAKLRFFPEYPTSLDSVLFDYQLLAILKHYDIEYTDKRGNKTHLNRFWLESSKDQERFHIMVVDSSYELKERVGIFHWINPKFHGKLITASGFGGGIGTNLGTVGWGEGIEQTWVYFLEGGVVVFEDNSFGGYLMPIDINIGSLLPMISNFNAGPLIVFDGDGWKFGGGIGAVF